MIKINRNQVSGEKGLSNLRILVAPLDWGLGHATRCIPVIYELRAQNADVWIAGEGEQQALLEQEFPDLPFLQLAGYKVKYGSNRRSLVRKLFLQAPRLVRAIKAERLWLDHAVREHGFDGIISDSRFGLFHSSIPSVILSHQLRIKSPVGRWAEAFIQDRNYHYINRFSACWVPDFEKVNDSFAGDLSHPEKKPSVPLYYTGPLSRLIKTHTAEKTNHLFISLSGPEPQRTILENLVVDQVSRYNGTATIARGLPSTRNIMPSTNDIRFYNHLSTKEYNHEMEQADWVISRSGYSTIMDICQLGKKAILIPTPGQTEQEYLADYLQSKNRAYAVRQSDFILQRALEQARSIPLQPYSTSAGSELQETISIFLEQVWKNKFGGKHQSMADKGHT